MNRRKEPRYPVQEAAVLVVLAYGADRTFPVKILDVSRSGMRVEVLHFLSSGSAIAVQIKDVLVFGTAQYCTEVGNGRWSVGVGITKVSGEKAEALRARKSEFWSKLKRAIAS